MPGCWTVRMDVLFVSFGYSQRFPEHFRITPQNHRQFVYEFFRFMILDQHGLLRDIRVRRLSQISGFKLVCKAHCPEKQAITQLFK